MRVKAKKLYAAIALALAAMLVASTAAIAAVTFDPATGTGFVGKGDVQLALGYNNKQLQDNADSLVFTATSVTEQSWVCTNDRNENTQERARTTTTQGVVSKVDRVKNQITGFILSGYVPGSETSTTDGPPLNSCPSGPWALTSPAGDPVPVEGEGGLFVNGVQIYPPAPAPTA
jgi:hypothetical protein